MSEILFICQWNVNRSQIAEGFYNHRYWTGASISIAGSRDRVEKYGWKPRSDIVEYMMKYYQIDISQSRIQFLCDLTDDVLWRVKRVIFFYNPVTIPWINDIKCDPRCLKDGMSPYDFFVKKNVPIEIYHINRLQDGEGDVSSEIWNMIKSVKTVVNSLEM